MFRPMLAATAVTAILSGSALAQQEQGTGQGQPMPTQTPEAQGQAPAEEQPAEGQVAAPPDGVFIPAQEEGLLLASELMNVSVVDANGEDIGGVDDVIVDPDGGIFGAVVSVGGFLGIGEKQVALSWSEFKYSPQEQTANLNVTREQLEQAPDFMTLADIKAEEEEAAAQQQQQMMQGTGGGMAPSAPAPTQ